MADSIDASFGNDARTAAAGKHIHQQNVTMQHDLTTALQEFRLDLWRVRRDLEEIASTTNRYWFSLVIVLIVVAGLVIVGDRQLTAQRTDLHEAQEQIVTLQQQVSTLQYQMQTLRELR